MANGATPATLLGDVTRRVNRVTAAPGCPAIVLARGQPPALAGD